jgi:hypothetical protein
MVAHECGACKTPYSGSNPDSTDTWASNQRLDQIAELLVLIAEYSERAGPRPVIANEAFIQGEAAVNIHFTATADGTVTPPPAPDMFRLNT